MRRGGKFKACETENWRLVFLHPDDAAKRNIIIIFFSVKLMVCFYHFSWATKANNETGSRSVGCDSVIFPTSFHSRAVHHEAGEKKKQKEKKQQQTSRNGPGCEQNAEREREKKEWKEEKPFTSQVHKGESCGCVRACFIPSVYGRPVERGRFCGRRLERPVYPALATRSQRTNRDTALCFEIVVFSTFTVIKRKEKGPAANR